VGQKKPPSICIVPDSDLDSGEARNKSRLKGVLKKYGHVKVKGADQPNDFEEFREVFPVSTPSFVGDHLVCGRMSFIERGHPWSCKDGNMGFREILSHGFKSGHAHDGIAYPIRGPDQDPVDL
jgi:hypothetical protein